MTVSRLGQSTLNFGLLLIDFLPQQNKITRMNFVGVNNNL